MGGHIHIIKGRRCPHRLLRLKHADACYIEAPLRILELGVEVADLQGQIILQLLAAKASFLQGDLGHGQLLTRGVVVGRQLHFLFRNPNHHIQLGHFHPVGQGFRDGPVEINGHPLGNDAFIELDGSVNGQSQGLEELAPGELMAVPHLGQVRLGAGNARLGPDHICLRRRPDATAGLGDLQLALGELQGFFQDRN